LSLTSIKHKVIFLQILLTLTGFFSVSAQQIQLQGIVTDSLKKPLPFANLLAIPQEEGINMAFAITNEKGLYELKLQAGKEYELNVTYWGFAKHSEPVNIQQNTTKNFELKEELGSLEEIILKHQIPVIVKQDTLIYNTDSFRDGTERKLRDLLKNLPGIEVDRDGNVFSNGKRITHVLVDGKTFFTGDSKLAVNNIPADAADKIEIIDDYHQIALFKGLEQSDDMAMNIVLKEDKKKFVFGDVEAGSGIKDRYLLHPKLFYYSPNTTLNLIADVNNIEEKAFTLRDYLEFEGGMSKLMQNAGAYFELFNSDIAQYLANRDFTSNESQFGALNIRQAVLNNSDINAYVIATNSETQTLSTAINQYNTNEGTFEENRVNTGDNNLFFTLGKATWRYNPSIEKDISFSTFFKFTNTDTNGSIATQSPFQNNQINTTNTLEGFEIKNILNYSKRFARTHTLTTEVEHQYQKNNPFNQWITNQPILQNLIPLEEEEIYTILQTQKQQTSNLTGLVKHYWVLHRFHHVYTSIGAHYSGSKFLNIDSQLLGNGESNNFSDAGFNNDFTRNFLNTHIGIEYKFQEGKTVFKPMLYFHNYHLKTTQIDITNEINKFLLLPKLFTEVTFSNSEKLTFNYALNARYASVNQLADRFILSNFNSVFLGNSSLENDRFHTASLQYNRFRMFKGFHLNASTNFRKSETSFKNSTELSGIEQYNTVVLFDTPEHTWTTMAQLSQVIKNIRVSTRASYTYSDFYQIVNNTENLNISKRISGTISARTLFDKFPKIEVGFTKDYNNYRTSEGSRNFENDQLFGSLDYSFWGDFIFKADYNYSLYKNKAIGISNDFDNANASLFYQKEGSAWGFEVIGSNIFNNAFKQQNSFSDFLISDVKTFIFPRVWMLKVIYKL